MDNKDKQQAAFESAYLSANGFHTKAELANEWKDGMLSSHMFRAGWEAATEAAKATSVAVGELPPLPEADATTDVNGKTVVRYFNDLKMRAYGKACGDAAIQSHIAENGDPLYWRGRAVQAEAARQPALALPVKTWQERLKDSASEGWTTLSETHMQAEIAELRAALAATAAPVAMPEGVTIKAFQAAHEKAWHITIKHPFGTSSVRMSDQRDIQLAELIAATNRSQP